LETSADKEPSSGRTGNDSFWSQIRGAFTGTGRELLRRWPWYAGIFVLVACISWFAIQPLDDYWMHLLRDGGKPGPGKKAAAEWIGSTGDELGFNLGAFAILWITGRLARRPHWQRAAMASLAAMVIAGLLCNVLRPTLGRPRPSTQAKLQVPDTLSFGRGFAGGHAYQSFPSAHTATAFGTATAVLVACPPAGMPLMACAGAMAWARMVQNAHHPSDVVAGAALGLLVGVAAGRRAKAAIDGDGQPA
jgi:membrane-associated phospholipid phosphatase